MQKGEKGWGFKSNKILYYPLARKQASPTRRRETERDKKVLRVAAKATTAPA